MSTALSCSGLAALLALTIQNTGIALLMRLAVTSGSNFAPTTAVCCDEALKLVVCSAVMAYYYLSSPVSPVSNSEAEPLVPHERSTRGFLTFFSYEIGRQGLHEYCKMSVPALLYTIQKNLLYIALHHLQPVVYQVSSQSKILTTAVFSFLILGRRLQMQQVFALILLCIGVITVQRSAVHSSSSETVPDANPILGMIAVQVASLTSGFSAVYFELMLKGPARPAVGAATSSDQPRVGPDCSLWVRNIQLGSFALPIALAGAAAKDGNKIMQYGFFTGYTMLTVGVICLEALGGIFVAMVMKYADSILKNFATAVSICLCACLSSWLMGFSLSFMFLLGAVQVVAAVFLYQIVFTPAVETCKSATDSPGMGIKV